MWTAVDRVEDSPRSGEERGVEPRGDGLDSTSGLQWEGRGSRSCLHYEMAAAVEIWTGAGHAMQGPLGSFPPIITFTAAGGGGGTERRGEEGKKKERSPMMYTPQACCTWRQ